MPAGPTSVVISSGSPVRTGRAAISTPPRTDWCDNQSTAAPRGTGSRCAGCWLRSVALDLLQQQISRSAGKRGRLARAIGGRPAVRAPRAASAERRGERSVLAVHNGWSSQLVGRSKRFVRPVVLASRSASVRSPVVLAIGAFGGDVPAWGERGPGVGLTTRPHLPGSPAAAAGPRRSAGGPLAAVLGPGHRPGQVRPKSSRPRVPLTPRRGQRRDLLAFVRPASSRRRGSTASRVISVMSDWPDHEL